MQGKRGMSELEWAGRGLVGGVQRWLGSCCAAHAIAEVPCQNLALLFGEMPRWSQSGACWRSDEWKEKEAVETRRKEKEEKNDMAGRKEDPREERKLICRSQPAIIRS